MAVRIRMQRRGKKKKAFYAIVVADKEMARDGRFLEKVGTYDPHQEGDAGVFLHDDRVAHWLGLGATPSDKVAGFIKTRGIEATRPGA